MHFAVLDNVKVRPIRGQVGFCPMCGSVMIAKCGKVKIHHWAHKGKLHCDKWWESETPWHREWKNHFPLDWQEKVHYDSTGEKHIADLKTPHGLIVEFQHSLISKEEQDARENFYKTMIWVVDGTRKWKDLDRFYSIKKEFVIKTNIPDVTEIPFPEKVFPLEWINRNVFVFFDFGESRNKHIIYTFYRSVNSSKYLCKIFTKEMFVEIIKSGKLLEKIISFGRNTNEIEKAKKKEPTHYLDKGKWKKRRRW